MAKGKIKIKLSKKQEVLLRKHTERGEIMTPFILKEVPDPIDNSCGLRIDWGTASTYLILENATDLKSLQDELKSLGYKEKK